MYVLYILADCMYEYIYVCMGDFSRTIAGALVRKGGGGARPGGLG